MNANSWIPGRSSITISRYCGGAGGTKVKSTVCTPNALCTGKRESRDPGARRPPLVHSYLAALDGDTGPV